MRHLDLFSGIGGFAIATEMVWPDAQHVFCDIDPFSQAVLRKHWPDSPIYGDIRKLSRADVGTVDLVTGGFPCQPFSSAGKRRGTEDDRHLWPEMLRVIRETRPRWVLGENVAGLLTWDDGVVVEQVFADLEREGYRPQAFVVPACAVGAPHRRDRVWIAAHRDRIESERWGESRVVGGTASAQQRKGLQRQRTGNAACDSGAHDSDPKSGRRKGRGIPVRQCGSLETEADAHGCRSDVADATCAGRREGNAHGGGIPPRERALGTQERRRPANRSSDEQWIEDWPSAAARLCTVDDGLPGGLVRPRGWRNAALKAAGNAIVPQVAAEVLRAMLAADTQYRASLRR